MTRKSLICVCCVLLTALPARASDLLPLPPELEPDYQFWLSIFTRYDSGEGVLHDNRNLGVVYERVAAPPELSRRERQRRIQARREAIADTLETLARGKREGLTAEEARILALWPEDVDSATLAAAAKRIRFQLGLSDRFREGIERSGRWRPYIEAELTALGVPLELAALPHVESSYNPSARSHVGASGIWQFTRSTARRYMRVDHVLDERNDPYTATRGAAQLLAYNYSIAGNWPMAITAYNHGLAGVRRAMRRHGDDAYVDIFRNYNGRTFGFASRNFYVAFLAAAHVDANIERYFPGVQREPPLEYMEAELEGYAPIDEVARMLSMSPSELAAHNPALQPTIWQGTKHLPRGYRLRVPRGRLERPLGELLAAAPPDFWASEQLPDLFHTVARGDTLSEIAEAYDTRVSTLVALNNLGSRHRIRTGQQLRLPAAGPAPAAVVAQAPVEAIAEPVAETAAEAAVEAAVVDSVTPSGGEAATVEEVTPAALSEAEPAPAVAGATQTALLSDPSDYSVADDGTIEVQPLETLVHFGDWLDIRTQQLRDANGFAFRTPVEVGQRIRLVFEDVDAETFENRRIQYHRSQQDRFFREHVITGTTEHEIRRGESLWVLSLRVYGVPLWLLRQYNPGLDTDDVRPGTVVRFPQLADADRS